MREDDRDRVSRLGTEAWKRLKKTKDFYDWVKVGDAVQCGREWAMNQAGTNRPEGKAYNFAFGEWLQRYKLDDLDKGDRSRLFQMMEALPQIEEWRRTLTLTERLKLNHPNAVLRKFKAAFEIPDPSKPVKPGLRDAVAELSEQNMQLKNENARLKAHVEEVVAARSTAREEMTLEAARETYIRCYAGLPDEVATQEYTEFLRELHDKYGEMTKTAVAAQSTADAAPDEKEHDDTDDEEDDSEPVNVKPSPYKSVTYKGTITSAVSGAFAELQELRDEMQDITDNMSGANMEHMPKYELAEAAASELEQCCDEQPEVPDAIGRLEVEFLQAVNRRKGRGPSRAVRLDNAISALQAVRDLLQERGNDDDAKTLIQEIEGACDLYVEFPGMYG